MPLQNRVTPFGDIVAVQAHGAMMGNRGGRIHDPATKKLVRRWTSRAWICCLLDYKGAHHEPMGEGYTSLFFLDEVTALSAGHRPCFYCRRADAKAFLGHLDRPMRAPEFDRVAHTDRLAPGRGKRTYASRLADLPDGTMVAIDGEAHAVRDGMLLPWSFEGYGRPLPRREIETADVLTPRCFVAILAAGYRPAWHASAGA